MSGPRGAVLNLESGAKVFVSNPGGMLELLKRVVAHVRDNGPGEFSEESRKILMSRGANQSSLLCCALIELADKLGVR